MHCGICGMSLDKDDWLCPVCGGTPVCDECGSEIENDECLIVTLGRTNEN